MSRFVLWSARLALAILLAVAIHGALDPQHNSAAFPIGHDEIEHIVLAYGLSVLIAASFPRLNPYVVASGVLVAGAALETSQALGLISGGFELRDALANAAGAVAAILPLAIARRSSARRR